MAPAGVPQMCCLSAMLPCLFRSCLHVLAVSESKMGMISLFHNIKQKICTHAIFLSAFSTAVYSGAARSHALWCSQCTSARLRLVRLVSPSFSHRHLILSPGTVPASFPASLPPYLASPPTRYPSLHYLPSFLPSSLPCLPPSVSA